MRAIPWSWLFAHRRSESPDGSQGCPLMMEAATRGLRQRGRRAWRRLADAVARPPLILMYHRVAQDSLDPWGLCVSPANFAAHLDVIRRQRRPMRVGDLVAKLGAGDRPRRAVVVTFDDGYRDNLEAALPLLAAADVPATVFCTAGCIGREQPFWWDHLAALVLAPDRLPEALELDVGGRSRRWGLGAAVSYTSADRASDRHWQGDENRDSPRLLFFRDVWNWLRPLDEANRASALRRIGAWSGVGEEVAIQAGPLSHDQALELARHPLIEIGAHTVTHAALSTLSRSAQQREIGESRARLEDLIGRPVTSFAYPFGDYGTETADLVREAGFRSACTTQLDAVRSSSNLFHLPRVGVADCDGDTFAKTLSDVLG
jgi:peptidoglycan/xylan/chitin deacetylase (PgdA/CDA1 family)